MARFSKFKWLFALTLNFKGGHFDKRISKFGYFKILEKKILQSYGWGILQRKSYSSEQKWMDGWVDGWV